MRHNRMSYPLIVALVRREASRRAKRPVKMKVTKDQALRLLNLAESVDASVLSFVRAQYKELDYECCMCLFKISYIPIPVLLSDKAITRYKRCDVHFIQPKEDTICERIKQRNPDAYTLWQKSRSVKPSRSSLVRKDQSS